MRVPDDLWFAVRDHLSHVENVLMDLLDGAPDNLTREAMSSLRRLMHDAVHLNKLID